MNNEDDKKDFGEEDFSDLIDGAKKWGNVGALFSSKDRSPEGDPLSTEIPPLITEERKALLLQIHEFVKELLGDTYGEHRLLVAASAGSMKDILLPINAHEAIMIDGGDFLGKRGADNILEFIQASKTDPVVRDEKAQYVNAYKRNEPHGHVATVNLPDKAGRLGFILWELEELGVDMSTVSAPKQDGGAWVLEFDYQHPTESQPTRRKITFFQSLTSDLMRNEPLVERLRSGAQSGIDVILQKAAESAYSYPEFQDLVFELLKKNGIIISDRFETLKNKSVQLKTIEESQYPQALQDSLNGDIRFGYYDKLLIAQKQ